MADRETLDALAQMNTQIALLNQSIREQIMPLTQKHESCLYGDDGSDGLTAEIVKQKGQIYELIRAVKGHVKSHMWWASTIIIVTCALAGIIVKILK
nr:hypothetical protein 29 [Elusimicrobiota bacterium]